MKKTIISLFFLSFIFSAWPQKAVYPLPFEGATPKGNSVCYALPLTAFEVTVTVTKVREIKGYYTEYAQTLLGLTNVISENRTFYKVKDVNIKPVKAPNPQKTYLVLLDKDQQNLQKELAEEPSQWLSQSLVQYSTTSTPIPNFFKNYSDPSYTEMEDSFTETKIIDGVVTQVPANRTKLVNVTNSQKAQQAADAISKSRQDQYNLVKGDQETPYSDAALWLMLKELKQWEENYLSLFTGLVLEDELTYTFMVYPTDMKTPLFSIHQDEGLHYGYQIDKTEKLYCLELELEPNVVMKEGEHHELSGYRYCTPVPMTAVLTVKDPATTATTHVFDFGTVQMYQFGRVQSLPPHQDIDLSKIGFIY
ncbi:MAG: DUF4831 family protein [Bacteroidales bacterium]|nr:DUF4831 family protein [Bacteroidales bacterium]